MTTAVSARRNQVATRILAGAFVSAGLGYLVLRGLNWDALVGLARNARPVWLFPAFATCALANGFRAARFSLLVGRAVTPVAMYPIVTIHNFTNALLPIRSGEVAYVWLLHRAGRVPGIANVGSLVVARLLDGAAVLLALLVALPLAMAGGSSQHVDRIRGAALLAAAVVGITVLVAFLAVRRYAAVRRMLRTVNARWSNRWLGAVTDALARAEDVVHQWATLNVLGPVLVYTILTWLSIFVTFCFICRALALPLGFAGCVVAGSPPVIVSSLPVPTLANIGAYEAAWVLGLSLAGTTGPTAVSSSLAVHGMNLAFAADLAIYGTVTVNSRRWEGGRHPPKPADFPGERS